MTPRIYHLHPLVAGTLRTWPETFARVAAMGFTHVCLAPPFAPGAGGDIFVQATFDRLHPALDFAGPASAGLALVVEQASRHGLRLLLDIAPAQVALDAPVRQGRPDWFAVDGEDRPPDPRRPPNRIDVAVPRFAQADLADAVADWWGQQLVHLLATGIAGFRCLNLDRVPGSFWRRVIAISRTAAAATAVTSARATPTGKAPTGKPPTGKPPTGAPPADKTPAGAAPATGGATATPPLFLAWTPGLTGEAIFRLAGVGFDLTCSSCAWWDGRAAWFLDEQAALQHVAPALASPEPSFQDRLAARLPADADLAIAYRLALGMATATSAGLFVPMGFEYATARRFDSVHAGPADLAAARADAPADLSADLRAANSQAERLPRVGVLRAISGPGSPATAWLRTDATDLREATEASLLVFNPDTVHALPMPVTLVPLPPSAGAPFAVFEDGAAQPLQPGEVRILPCRRTNDITGGPSLDLTRAWAQSTRFAIEAVAPVVQGGVFPAKTIVGRPVTVSADVIGDGHDILAADLLWRPAGDGNNGDGQTGNATTGQAKAGDVGTAVASEASWQRVPMRLVTNDRWAASILPARIGLYEFAVEAWWDHWATFTHDLHAKVAAGQVVTLEIQEGRQLVEQAAQPAPATLLPPVSAAPDAQVASLLSPAMQTAMQAADARPFAARSATHTLRADRPAAGFASWYELFPRSVTHDPKVHGTFRSVIERLPAIRAMGFDVLYFPPINPIGTINRKGRNNSLRAEPGDVGSPYAIGSAEGGHDAVNPALGTLDDFRDMLRQAHAHGLEIAVDFAIQCAPDHPWVSQHKDWFRWRPDGSMRYAENPPKKYEDIVNPDFFNPACLPDVWLALRDVIQFWVDQGVRIFRVDNPHTKPLPFWHWMIADIQSRHPDVLFLAEAFTRPKLMYRLAKVGFSQSYTYFTWRNTKQELTEYLTELTTPPVADFFRPNFFVNTPDINPVFLQTSGRPGFLIRAALAATLAGLWGVYSGFEICEAAPLPGREEYLDSEKYEIRPRNFAAPGNIVAEITALNRLRRLHPALQTHLGLTFHPADNDQIILYSKREPGAATMILVAVSLDPYAPQEAAIELPLWTLGLTDNAAVAVTDLMREESFTWYGNNQRVRLDPADVPFRIWRLALVGAP